MPGRAKAAGKTGVDMIIDLVNQIEIEGVRTSWNRTSVNVDCCKKKGDFLERGN